VNGKILVQDGLPLHIELPTLVERHNSAAQSLLARAGAR
jgi:hypothetical protein